MTQHTDVTQGTQTEPTSSPRRSSNITLWVVQVVTAAGFLFAAGAKFAGLAPVAATFHAIGLGDWLRHAIGTLEVVGAVALLIPRVAGLAGLAFVMLMVGAAFTHIVIVGHGVTNTLPLLVLSSVVAWGRRRTIVAALRLVR